MTCNQGSQLWMLQSFMDKVRNYLDTMDVSNLHPHLPFSSTSSSSSSSSDSNSCPLSVGPESWQVGGKKTQQILSVIQPTTDSENRRKHVIDYLQGLIGDAYGIKVLPFGSVPLKTYLPHGDVDLAAISHYGTVVDLAAGICSLLENEERNNASILVRDVLCVPAQVRVVKCTVDDIAVDISFNQTSGLSALYFLEQVDQYIGRDHLFKRSVILIKAWCYYESRILGGFHGLISTYALETMVLHVINLFHSSLHCPLSVLYKFLDYYSTFDWMNYCIGLNGLVLISSLPKIEVIPLRGCDELLLTEEFLRNSRDALLASSGVNGTAPSPFPVKYINIVDPLKDDNNLGRSVSKGNFYRIKSALSYGAQRLADVLILPPEKIGKGLEKFFNNTITRNGKGRRVDVLSPVPKFGTEHPEIAAASDSDDILCGIQYGLWFDDDVLCSGQLSAQANHQFWYSGWGVVSHFDRHAWCSVESPPSSVGSPGGLPQIHTVSFEDTWKPRGTLSSVDSPRGLQPPNAPFADEKWKPSIEKWKSRGNLPSGDSPRGFPFYSAVPAEEKRKTRGTSSFFDSSKGSRVHSGASVEGSWKSRRADFSTPHGSVHKGPSVEEKWKSRKPYAPADCVRGFQVHKEGSIEEKWRSGGVCPYIPLCDQNVQKKVTLEEDGRRQKNGREVQRNGEEHEKDIGNIDSQITFSMEEFPLLHGSKPIPMKIPVTSGTSEEMKETLVLDSKPLSPTSMSSSDAGKEGSLIGDPTTVSIVATEEQQQDISKSKEKLLTSVEPPQLADETEFPALGRPENPVKPVIKVNKKEFPPLSACLKSQKKKWKNTTKEVVKIGV